MTQSITFPAYLFDDKELVMIRETCLAVMQADGECEQALACIAAVNEELDERALAVYLKHRPTHIPTPRRPNLYIVR